MSLSQRHIAAMKAYYDARAPWHDAYMSYTSREEMLKRSAEILSIVRTFAAGKRVLEIACGTGQWTPLFAELARKVVAIDSSPRCLEIARAKSAVHKNVSFILADAYRLAGLPGQFDFAFVAGWYSHVPKSLIRTYLQGLPAKLKPYAWVVFTYMTLKEAIGQDLLRYDEEGNRISRRELPDGSIHEVIKDVSSEEEVRLAVQPFGDQIHYRKFRGGDHWLVTNQASGST